MQTLKLTMAAAGMHIALLMPIYLTYVIGYVILDLSVLPVCTPPRCMGTSKC
jgi:hypothetical protein